MQRRNVCILGTGKYLPKKTITAQEMDRKLGIPSGWVAKKSGVMIRHFVEEETASQMGAAAALAALDDAGLTLEEIDCIVCTSGTSEQEIPCTAVFIQQQLGKAADGIPCFDVNSTCLSFVTGLDTLSYMVDAGHYQRVLLVASEIASVGLNWNHKESCALFGDGAAAVVIGQSTENQSSQILCSRMETYSEGATLSEVRGGGTKFHPRSYSDSLDLDDFLFDMDGKALFRMSSRILSAFTDRLLEPAGLSLSDIKLVIPHQASIMAMRIIRRRLGLAEEQMMVIAPNHGNTIAASIPMGIHEAIQQQKITRGDHILLLGTSAGLSIGGMVLVY